MNKHILKSLKLQLFFAVIISLATAALAFGISFFLGDILLDKTVYGYAFSKGISDKQFDILQEYVEEEQISLNNLKKLNIWCSQRRKTYLTIYSGDSIVYESPLGGKPNKNLDTSNYDQNLEDPDYKYTLTLADGLEVHAFLYNHPGSVFYFGMIGLSGILAFIAFSFCFIILVNKKISYITLLQKELEILSGGQLEYSVTIEGKDELSELARGIDQMRCSIIKHQEAEKQMRTANSELITAMSHDLRTPLTSLLAYLEIVDRKKYADEEQMQNLIHKSVGQTMRIKSMADTLFEYFLAYSTEPENSEMIKIEADQLFLQILDDYAASLENQDLTVERNFSSVSGKISVNTELLQRTFDNLYSNLLKYADPNYPICLSYKQRENNIVLTITNKIKISQEKQDSTHIGLNICRNIINLHKGSFNISGSDGTFSVVIELPLLNG